MLSSSQALKLSSSQALKLSKVASITFGLIFLFASFQKLLDPFFVEKFFNSATFVLSILADVSLSSVLLFVPGSKRTFQIATLFFFVFLGYLVVAVLTNRTTCGCFGNETPTVYPFAIDLLGVLIFGSLALVTRKQGDATEKNQNDSNIFRLWTLNFVILLGSVSTVGLVYQSLSASNGPLQTIHSSIELEPDNPLQKLRLELSNTSGNLVRITGLPPSCKMALVTPIPIEIQPGCSQALTFVAPQDKLAGAEGSFIHGEFSIFVESESVRGNFTSTSRVRWGTVVKSMEK